MRFKFVRPSIAQCLIIVLRYFQRCYASVSPINKNNNNKMVLDPALHSKMHYRIFIPCGMCVFGFSIQCFVNIYLNLVYLQKSAFHTKQIECNYSPQALKYIKPFVRLPTEMAPTVGGGKQLSELRKCHSPSSAVEGKKYFCCQSRWLCVW